MSKHIWKIWIPVTTLIILIVAYGLFRLWQYRTHSHRLDKAITSIIDTLSADPDYIVTERIVIKAKEPDFFDIDYLMNLNLQVCVRKGFRKGPPNWGIKLDKIVRKLPRFLRPSRDLYLYSTEYNWIIITAVEPATEELQKLKEQVMSLGISRDIRIGVKGQGQTFPFSLRVDRKPTSTIVCLWLDLFVSNMKAQFTMSPFVAMSGRLFFRQMLTESVL